MIAFVASALFSSIVVLYMFELGKRRKFEDRAKKAERKLSVANQMLGELTTLFFARVNSVFASPSTIGSNFDALCHTADGWMQVIWLAPDYRDSMLDTLDKEIARIARRNSGHKQQIDFLHAVEIVLKRMVANNNSPCYGMVRKEFQQLSQV